VNNQEFSTRYSQCVSTSSVLEMFHFTAFVLGVPHVFSDIVTGSLPAGEISFETFSPDLALSAAVDPRSSDPRPLISPALSALGVSNVWIEIVLSASPSYAPAALELLTMRGPLVLPRASPPLASLPA
jgi:hypothetical protein